MNEPFPLTIENSRAARTRLLELCAGDSPIDVDLCSLTDIDLSGIQLLVAAIREAGLQGKEIRFTGDISPDVVAKLSLAGFGPDACNTAWKLEVLLKNL